jgi:prepilin-type N-terminal cleavage/methylation domain-containing protein
MRHSYSCDNIEGVHPLRKPGINATGPSARSWRGRALPRQRGFTLFEVVIALGMLGTAVIAIVSVMATTTRAGSRSRENTTLLHLARAEVEAIQKSPYQSTPTNYPIISAPDGYAVSFTSTDPGTTYSYASTTTVITGAVQQITVTATGDTGSVDITFYKIDVP